jgi:hypothetical protein
MAVAFYIASFVPLLLICGIAVLSRFDNVERSPAIAGAGLTELAQNIGIVNRLLVF